MKKLLLIGILFLSGCASKVQLSRPASFQEVAVVAFDFTVEPFASVKYEGKAGPTADIVEAIRMVEEIKKTINDIKNPEKSEWKSQRDSLYWIIEAGLKNDLGLALLPLDHLRGEIDYDYFGYPKGSAKKVAQSGKYAAALEITARLTFTTVDTSSLDLVFWGKTKNVQLPQLALHVKMMEKSGKVVWNDKVSVTSETPVVVDETWLFGIKHKKEEHGPALTDLFSHAMRELVRKTTNI